MAGNGATNQKKNYFEIAGKPGRIYLRNFAFGPRHNALEIEAQKGTVRSPVTLSPVEEEFWPANPLFKVLENYAWDNHVMEKASDYARKLAPNAGILRECSIGAEWTSGRCVMRRTVYRFFRCKIMRLPNPQQKGLNTDLIEVEFDHIA